MLTDFPRNILKLAGLSVKINFFSFSTTIISKYLSLFSQKAPRLYRGGLKKIILFLNITGDAVCVRQNPR